MKAEDLTIGDWVHCITDDTYVQIDEIFKHEEYGWCYKYNGKINILSDVEPISLTEEILEKNGYYYNETRNAWELIPNNGFGICKDENDNCFYFCLGIFDAFNRDSDITYHYITKVEYAHELQHLLKLCKIEKDIKI